MFGFCVFGVHLDGELFVHQQDEGDRSRVWLHVQQEGVLHHQPATAHKQTVAVVISITITIKISESM